MAAQPATSNKKLERISSPPVCVSDLGVELHGTHRPVQGTERSHGKRVGGRQRFVARGWLVDVVPVRAPDGRGFSGLEASEDSLIDMHCELGSPVFTTAMFDLGALQMSDEMEAVADAQHWNARVQQLAVRGGYVVVVHRRRTTAQDHGGRIPIRESTRAIAWEGESHNKPALLECDARMSCVNCDPKSRIRTRSCMWLILLRGQGRAESPAAGSR